MTITHDRILIEVDQAEIKPDSALMTNVTWSSGRYEH